MHARNSSAQSPGRTTQGRVIAIDGPAGAGKSTAARVLAQRLGFYLLDSGALYRVMGLHLLRSGISDDRIPVPRPVLQGMNVSLEPGIGTMRLFLDGEEVTEEIRTEKIGNVASRFSARPEVRQSLVDLQRSAAAKWNLVAEGRDMGTVVFPDAAAKFFLTAKLEVRARRRYDELKDRGDQPDYGIVLSQMADRDLRDETRAEAPLRPAPDAIVLDTSSLDVESVVNIIIVNVRERGMLSENDTRRG